MAQKAEKPLHEGLLYVLLLLHAQTKNWRGFVEFEGHTCVKKLDTTTDNTVMYSSDTLFHGRSVTHWVLFKFEDDKRADDTLNAGMILGFVRFTGIKDQNNGLCTCCGSVFAGISKF